MTRTLGWAALMLVMSLTFGIVNILQGDTGWAIVWLVLTAINGFTVGGRFAEWPDARAPR